MASEEIDGFISWLEEQGIDIEEATNSMIVGLAEDYCEDNDIDLEDVVTGYFAEYVYDPENDPNQKEDDMKSEEVWTPDGVGVVQETKNVDGENYVHVVTASDIGPDGWYHEDEVAGVDEVDEVYWNSEGDDLLSEYATDDEQSNEESILMANLMGADIRSRLAGRHFTYEEQQALIDEDGIADQLEELDLNGTHYL